MTHDEARALLSALIDGGLDAREATRLTAHLDECAACRADLGRLRATVAMLKEVEPVQAPEGFAATVRARLEEVRRTERPGLWARMRRGAPIRGWSWQTAAVVAAVALVGLFAANIVREIVPVEPRPTVVRDKQDPAGAQRSLGLAPQAAQEPGREMAAVQVPTAPGVDAALRRVIRTGQVTLEVDRFEETSQRLLTIAEGAGGFIADSSYTEDGGVPRGTFVVRVPAGRFAEVMREIEGLGMVRRRQVSGQDVTEEFVDLEARVRNLQRQEARLLTFMDRATRIPDLMAIENEVARVRGEIERLTGRLRFLTNRIDLATIQAEVREKPKVQPGGFWDFDRTLARIQTAFLNTVRQVLGAAETLVAFAAGLAPVVLLLVGAWLVVRRSLRKAPRAV